MHKLIKKKYQLKILTKLYNCILIIHFIFYKLSYGDRRKNHQKGIVSPRLHPCLLSNAEFQHSFGNRVLDLSPLCRKTL
jgi:hypothetical protein